VLPIFNPSTGEQKIFTEKTDLLTSGSEMTDITIRFSWLFQHSNLQKRARAGKLAVLIALQAPTRQE